MKPIKIDWDFVDSHPMADQADDESPELTGANFARMQPASAVLPKVFGAELATEMLKPKIRRLESLLKIHPAINCLKL